MRSVNYLGVLILFLGFSIVSCKKDSPGIPDNIVTYDVEYRIVPASIYITKVTYINEQGVNMFINDISQFSSGGKRITVSTIPFTAKLVTEANNTTTAPLSYSLSISVDGQVKNQVTANIPAMNSSTVTQVEYTIK
ncbi:MAG TPA: hypothetical protein VGD17_08405 [Chitinophagaceae bacterium]